MPFRKGSVFDCLMRIWMANGESLESNDTSLYDRCAKGSYSCTEGTVNSLHLRKPKKAMQQAGYRRMFS